MKLCLILIVSIGLPISLVAPVRAQDTAHEPGKPRVKEVLRIGYVATPDEEAEFVFAHVADMAADKNGDLYVLDGMLNRVHRVAGDGSVRSALDLQTGQGPGEVQTLTGIALSADGARYLLDTRGSKIHVFQADGRFGRAIPLDRYATQLVMLGGDLFLTNLWMQAQKGIVSRLTADGEAVQSFLELPAEWMSTARTGNFESVAVSLSANLLYSYPIPYRIIELTADGELVGESSGHASFANPTRVDGPVVRMVDGSRGLAVTPEGFVLNLVMEDEVTKYLDVFSPELQFRYRMEAADFGLEAFRQIAVDASGFVYLDALEPVPHLRKYEVAW